MTTVVVAEKPSVARDIARVLGASQKGDGLLRGSGYVVTWAIGHLVRLGEPGEIHPEWQRWAAETLPLLPREWPLVVNDKTKAQFEIVRRLLRDPEVGEVVCATDAGREGELIFRLLYAASGCTKPTRRLWISSLTPDAIRRGFAVLRPIADYDALADSAHARARADWLVGMNLSRAATLAHDELFSVGRVQTPTLALLVEREKAIRAFVPEDYREIVARFAPPRKGVTPDGEYDGTWFRGEKPTPEARRLPKDGVEAQRVVERVRKGVAEIEAVDSETRRLPPPLLYDLTELQRHANRLLGLSARQTLSVAQSLYETHKLLTYPRTDSRHLSSDVAAGLATVVAAIAGPYEGALAPGTGERPLGRRFVDDSRVSDHHAIIPTAVGAGGLDLSGDERRVYDLVCRRLLMAWHDDHVFEVTSVVTRVAGGRGSDAATVDRFASSGTAVKEAGWKALDLPRARTLRPGRGQPTEEDETRQDLPPGLGVGQPRRVAHVEAIAKKTRPPRRFTDATLLTAMETAGATLDDRELSEVMKGRGLGTPATRAEIIETLLRRAYAERQGKALAATATGVRLIDAIHPQVKSPALTGEWEAELNRIRQGTLRLPEFMQRIETFVRDLVGETLAAPRAGGKSTEERRPLEETQPKRARSIPEPPKAVPVTKVAERPSPRAAREPPRVQSPRAMTATDLETLLHERFRLPSFRPQQEAVCRAVVDGHDVLLVMPTGAGKSLCYQLPGLARGGTTLVVSPLIALMEDQTQKLQDLGLRAERIHSGRERQASRVVCQEYLEGRLDFLFIAPERLRVAGFPELLAKHRPTLVAVDEAHCISEWGHDFRPDYRLLGERLPSLRPAVIVALTATATPRVQADIAAQLGLATPRRFIHGFRRTNIAIEAAVLKPGERTEAARGLLRPPERRPAIVYAPTRKGAEEVSLALRADGQQAAAYHAGMPAVERDRVQSGFQSGAIDVVVATIAFGMGIDKADIRTVLHTGLPSSVEGYYQEIGRAGRDGHPSRAILLYSYADRRTHDFFLERDYPPPEDLDTVFRALAIEPEPIETVVRRTRLAPAEVEVALDRLWAHGGAIVLGEDVRRGRPDWRPSYLRQREHREGQIEEVLHFAESRDCRMLSLLRHFGDQEDRRGPCGHCDACAPDACVARRWRPPARREVPVLEAVLDVLRGRDGQGSGALHRDCGGGLERGEFERLLSGLAREGLIEMKRDSFEKNGETITFQRVSLTSEGRRATAAALTAVRVEDEGASGAPSRPGFALAKPRSKAGRRGARRQTGDVAEAHADGPLIARLKAWRSEEARRRGIPAFRIFTDRTLMALADDHPTNETDLLTVPGIGPKLAERYAATLLKLVSGGEPDAAPKRR